MKRLIIINGPPASGKTTVLDHLLEELRWSVATKDDIKERLLDGLGELNSHDNRQLSGQAFQALFEVIHDTTQKREDLLVEGNFKNRFSAEFNSLLDDADYSVLQIFCHANDEVLVSRYKKRITGSERHSGHEQTLDMVSVHETGQTVPLDINAELVDYDNSQGEVFNYQAVVGWTKQHDNQETI